MVVHLKLSSLDHNSKKNKKKLLLDVKIGLCIWENREKNFAIYIWNEEIISLPLFFLIYK